MYTIHFKNKRDENRNKNTIWDQELSKSSISGVHRENWGRRQS